MKIISNQIPFIWVFGERSPSPYTNSKYFSKVIFQTEVIWFWCFLAHWVAIRYRYRFMTVVYFDVQSTFFFWLIFVYLTFSRRAFFIVKRFPSMEFYFVNLIQRGVRTLTNGHLFIHNSGAKNELFSFPKK